MIEFDERQLKVVQVLETLSVSLSKKKYLFLPFKLSKSINGLYLWGPVGTGKTYVIHGFYNYLPIQNKARYHFHAFMQMIHEELKHIHKKTNPVKIIGKKFAKKVKVLCLDEFMVTNVVDAMIFTRLLKVLIEEGVCLIITSNTAPDDLYKDGLQRERFLPAIELIKKHTQVMQLDTEYDYRQRDIEKDAHFYLSSDPATWGKLKAWFFHFAEKEKKGNDPIEVLHREIKIIKRAETVIWFDFQAICGIPRSQNDFLELVKTYKTMIVSDIPQFTQQDHSILRTFINFIDVLYDAKIRFIFSASTPISELYPKGRYHHEFKRTESRLIEMQSGEWGRA